MAKSDFFDSEEIKEIFLSFGGARTPPSVVFHYTTPIGLLGLVSGRKIWATHHAFTNDAQELKHGIELFVEELSSRQLPRNGSTESVDSRIFFNKFLLSLIMESQNQNERWVDPYIACFCTNSDLLSQWRGYGANASGYSVGMARNELLKVARRVWSKAPPVILPVVYDDSEKRHYVRRLLDHLTSVFEREANNCQGQNPKVWARDAGAYAYKWVLGAAARMKHRGFAEENEWRVIVPVPGVHSHLADHLEQLPSVRHRDSGGTLTPYIEIPFDPDRVLKKIVVGPRSRQIGKGDAQASIELLFREQKLKCPDIKFSETPYR